MDVQPTNLLQLCDAIMSIWTKISEECFQHLVESMPRRIKAVLGVPNKVASECVYTCIIIIYNNVIIIQNKYYNIIFVLITLI